MLLFTELKLVKQWKIFGEDAVPPTGKQHSTETLNLGKCIPANFWPLLFLSLYLTPNPQYTLYVPDIFI